MIQVNDIIVLHNYGDYRVQRFYFDCTDAASYQCFVELINRINGQTERIPSGIYRPVVTI